MNGDARPGQLKLRVLVTALVTMCVALGPARSAVAAPPASPKLGSYPFAIVLCNFSNYRLQPNSLDYYNKLWTQAGQGLHGLWDYWHDVSFGQMNITGTKVFGWYTMPLTTDRWIGLPNEEDQILGCVNQAASSTKFANYSEVVAVTPYVNMRLTAELTPGANTMAVDSTNELPTPPFKVDLPRIAGNPKETVEVTRVDTVNKQLTISRGSSPQDFPAGTSAQTSTHVGQGFAPTAMYLGSDGTLSRTQRTGDTQISLGYVGIWAGDGAQDSSYTEGVGGSAHETGHGLGYDHSLALSKVATTDYNDCYDQMSFFSCIHAHPGTFGPQAGEVGMDAIDLGLQGWIPASARYNVTNSPSRQATIQLHPLGDTQALSQRGSSYLEATIPAIVPISTYKGNVQSTYYTLEYRQQVGWDTGISHNGVLLHLDAPYPSDPSYPGSYWVDVYPGNLSKKVGSAGDGVLRAGDDYADVGHNTYLFVNSVDPASNAATVTLGSAKIGTAISYTGDTAGAYGHSVTLSAHLGVSPGGAPVGGATVQLSIGSQGCATGTNASGDATCQLTLDQHSGTYPVLASYAGDLALSGATSPPASFLAGPASLALDLPLFIDQATPETFDATLTGYGGVPLAGEQVSFEVGSGRWAQSCTGTTGPNGYAECTINISQQPDTFSVPVSASAPADTVHLAASGAGTTQLFQYTLALYAYPNASGGYRMLALADRSVGSSSPFPIVGQPHYWISIWDRTYRMLVASCSSGTSCAVVLPHPAIGGIHLYEAFVAAAPTPFPPPDIQTFAYNAVNWGRTLSVPGIASFSSPGPPG